MAKLKLKLTHHIRALGGPWTTTYFEVNGIPVGSFRTRSREEREAAIAKHEGLNQEQMVMS